MANYEQELLKRCGEAFKALTAYSYQIKMFHDGIVSDINLKFTPSDFLHLTSLEKLDGIWQTSYMDSGYTSDGRRLFKKNEKMLENIIKERFDFKTVETAVNFFDDTNELPESIENARQSGCVIKSELLSRLSALENLYIIINNSELDTENIQKLFALKVYKWDKTARHESRPHSSKINADYLLEFHKNYNSEKPYVDFFIVGNSESYNGMSVFQSEKTYSCDVKEERNKRNLPVRSVTDSKMEILSFIEIRTDPKTKQQTETVIMKKSDEYIQQCEDECNKCIKAQKHDDKINRIISKFKNLRVEASKGKLFQYMKELHNIFRNDIADLKEISDKLEITESNRKEIAECISYERSELKKMIELKEKISGLENARTQFVNDSSNSYEEQIKAILDFLKKSAGKGLCEQVLDLLKSQKHSNNPENEWIDIEISEIDSIKSSKPEDNIKMIQLHNSDMHRFIPASAISDGTLAITQNPFMTALTSLTERFRTFVQNIADKIQETLIRALKELPNADTTPSEQTSEHDEQNTESASAPAPEKDITDDDEFIIRDVYSVFADSIGTQGYENYMAVVPADKLDFQIPFFYETEQVQITQELEQDIQVTALEFKKKQAEYDDF